MVKCVTFAGKLDFRWELCSCLSPHYIKERFFSLCIADQSPFIISVIWMDEGQNVEGRKTLAACACYAI